MNLIVNREECMRVDFAGICILRAFRITFMYVLFILSAVCVLCELAYGVANGAEVPMQKVRVDFKSGANLAAFTHDDQLVMVFTGVRGRPETIQLDRRFRSCNVSEVYGDARYLCLPIADLAGYGVAKIKSRQNGASWEVVFGSKMQSKSDVKREIASSADKSEKVFKLSWRNGSIADHAVFYMSGDNYLFRAFPSSDSRNFIDRKENFVDFTVLPTSHGLILQEFSKDVVVDIKPNNMTVASPYLKRMSPKNLARDVAVDNTNNTKVSEDISKNSSSTKSSSNAESSRSKKSSGNDRSKNNKKTEDVRVQGEDIKKKSNRKVVDDKNEQQNEHATVVARGAKEAEAGKVATKDHADSLTNILNSIQNSEEEEYYDEEQMEILDRSAMYGMLDPDAEHHNDRSEYHEDHHKRSDGKWMYDKDMIFGKGRRSILNFKTDHAIDGDDFIALKNELIVQSAHSHPDEGAKALFDLAMMYFSADWYTDAYTIMKVLLQDHSESLISDPRAAVLYDFVNLMKGYSTFDDMPKMKLGDSQYSEQHSDEVRFLQNILPYASLMSDYKPLTPDSKLIFSAHTNSPSHEMVEQMVDIFADYEENFLADYPDLLLLRMGVGVMRFALDAASSYTLADSVMKILRKILADFIAKHGIEALPVQDLGRLRYYHAKIAAQSENLDLAMKNFDTCMSYGDDLLYVECAFAKYNEMLKRNKISKKDYLEKLEEIKWHWRAADNLEGRLLIAIAQTQLDLGLHSMSMRTWTEIALYLKDKEVVTSALSEISRIFKDFFSDSNELAVSPVQTVAFYLEFADHLPIGAEGEAISMKVVDKLISLDLLGDAASLLEYQIKYKMMHTQRERAINTLANVYIALEKPEMAIDLIERVGLDCRGVSNTIFHKRRLAYYKALLNNGQYGDLEKMLQDEKDDVADEIMAHVYWDLKIWNKFTERSEPRIYRWRSKDLSPYLSYSYSEKRKSGSHHGIAIEDDNIQSMAHSKRYLRTRHEDDIFSAVANNYKGDLPKLNSKELVNSYFDNRGVYHLATQGIAYLMLDDFQAIGALSEDFAAKLPNNKYGEFAKNIIRYSEAADQHGLREMYSAEQTRQCLKQIVAFEPEE